MKRILSSAIILLLILCCATPCFGAEETTLTNEKRSASHAVTAKYDVLYEEMEHYTLVEDEDDDGVYTATTENGLTVTVVTDLKGLTLVIHEITEDEDPAAVKWFKNQFQGSKNIAPLEIFFIDQEDTRIDLPAGTEITLEGLKDDQYVVRLSTTGRKDRATEAVKNGSITVEATDSSDYYVVVTPGTPVDIGDVTDRPETGEQSLLWLWVMLMGMSAVGIIITAGEMKKA